MMFLMDKNGPRASLPQTPGKSTVAALALICILVYLHSALKRHKAYSALEDVRPTLKNKPSGLRVDWHSTVTRSHVPHRPPSMSTAHTRSSSSSTLSMSPSTLSSPSLEFDHASSLLALSPSPVSSKSSSPPSYGNLVPLVDSKMLGVHRHDGRSHSPVVCISYLSI